MQDTDTVFYNRLKVLVIASGKSFNQVEKEIKLPRNSLSNYKHGSSPSGDRLLKISHYFNVSPEYLLGQEVGKVLTNIEELFMNLSLKEKLEVHKQVELWFTDFIVNNI